MIRTASSISILVFCILCIGCSQFARLNVGVSDDVDLNLGSITVEEFANSLSLVKHDKPWIRGYNRWANEPQNKLLNSWSGTVNDQEVMLVELISNNHYYVVIDVNYGHGDPSYLVNKLKSQLASAGLGKNIVVEFKQFISFA